MTMMLYKTYEAVVEFDDAAQIFHGEVIHLRDVVTFQGESVVELKAAFADSVDDYLAFARNAAWRGESLRHLSHRERSDRRSG